MHIKWCRRRRRLRFLLSNQMLASEWTIKIEFEAKAIWLVTNRNDDDDDESYEF